MERKGIKKNNASTKYLATFIHKFVESSTIQLNESTANHYFYYFSVPLTTIESPISKPYLLQE